jgi:bla regulator protein blaR1
MELLVSYSFSAAVIVKALSWTLLHSLWQGLLLAVVSGAIVLGTKKAKPSLRYNLLVMAIGLFIVCVFVTFFNQLSINTQIVTSNLIQTLPVEITKATETSKVVIGQSSMIIQTINFINTNAIWIVAFWLMIIVIKFIKLGSGLYNIYKLKHKMVSPTSAYWNKRLKEMCRQLNINKKIVLLQSNILSIPSVIGYFKPVILFPAAMFSALTIKEIEAILMHELGHIRRNDFIINILQNILEVAFFFNPAVIWVSTLIKTERENCCDDIAVSFTGNKQDYIKALISFSEFEQTQMQQFATAFSGDNKHLLNRAKRIIYNKNNALNIMEKKFLSASLVLVTVCLLAFVSLKAQDAETEGNPILKTNINTNVSKDEMLLGAQDTIPVYKIRGKSGMTGVTNTTIDGKAYQIFIKNGQITNMYINGKKIPNEEIVNYKLILDKIYENMIIDQEMALYDSEKAIIDSKQELKDYEQAMRDSEQAMRDSEQAMRDSEQAMRDSEQAMRDSEQAMRDSEQAARDSEQALRDSEQIVRDNEMNEIIDELIAQKIIKNEKNLHSLMLNAEELVVNGIKQSADIHKIFKAKFTVSSNWSWIYESR